MGCGSSAAAQPAAEPSPNSMPQPTVTTPEVPDPTPPAPIVATSLETSFSTTVAPVTKSTNANASRTDAETSHAKNSQLANHRQKQHGAPTKSTKPTLPASIKAALLSRELQNQKILRQRMATDSSAYSYPLGQRAPMWMSKCFMGEFGDAFVEDTLALTLTQTLTQTVRGGHRSGGREN